MDKAISRTFQGRFTSLTKFNYKDHVSQLKLCGEIQIQTGFCMKFVLVGLIFRWQSLHT